MLLLLALIILFTISIAQIGNDEIRIIIANSIADKLSVLNIFWENGIYMTIICNINDTPVA